MSDLNGVNDVTNENGENPKEELGEKGEKLSIEARLGLVAFTIDSEPHIKLREEVCRECKPRYCLFVCPAKLYTEENGEIKFNYEGCLECGTCRIACPQELDWNYPRGGFGAHYQYG